MSLITKKGQVTITKPFREKLHIQEGDNLDFEVRDDVLIIKKRTRKSILSLAGIAQGRKIGKGDEREFTRKVISEKIAKEASNRG